MAPVYHERLHNIALCSGFQGSDELTMGLGWSLSFYMANCHMPFALCCPLHLYYGLSIVFVISVHLFDIDGPT